MFLLSTMRQRKIEVHVVLCVVSTPQRDKMKFVC